MIQSVFTRLKAIRLYLIGLLCFLLLLAMFFGDALLSKIHYTPVPISCHLCQFKENLSFINSTKAIHFSMPDTGKISQNAINVVFFFAHVKRKPDLKNKLSACISSLFKYATPVLHLHILTDSPSLNVALEVLKETTLFANNSFEVSFYDVNKLLEPLKNFIDVIRPHFSYKQGAYYSDGLFFISIGLFKVMSLDKVIVVDADVKFLDDVRKLYDHFNNFSFEALIGIAAEQQPVYRHVLYEYRRLYNDTHVGNPPPNGIPGFNSGILLLDLERIRKSSLYVNIVNNPSVVLQLVKKYKFKGHLGDQDFYTLINLEYPNIFYLLPCTWNRQLCQWWKYHGYKDIFEKYNTCNGKIQLLHGNCNTIIPDV